MSHAAAASQTVTATATAETVPLALRVQHEEKKGAAAVINSATHPDPLNLLKWIEDHKAQFAPPVGNKMITTKDAQMKTMIVGGPNTRTDYHINRGEEWFYQIKGDMILRVVDGGRFRDIVIPQGHTFLLPPGVPHSPQRYHDTYGLVIERERHADELDGLRWYCQNPKCRKTVFESFFVCQDLGSQLKVLIEKYYGDDQMRTCKHCGVVDPKPPKILTIEEARKLAHERNAVADKTPLVDGAAFIPNTHPMPFSLDDFMTKFAAQAKKAGGKKTQLMFNQEFKVTAVAGPEGYDGENTFHVNPTEEWFWQWQGSMDLSVLDNEKNRTFHVGEGDIFLLPRNIPHHAARKEGDSVGLVVQTTRVPAEAAVENGVKNCVATEAFTPAK